MAPFRDPGSFPVAASRRDKDRINPAPAKEVMDGGIDQGDVDTLGWGWGWEQQPVVLGTSCPDIPGKSPCAHSLDSCHPSLLSSRACVLPHVLLALLSPSHFLTGQSTPAIYPETGLFCSLNPLLPFNTVSFSLEYVLSWEHWPDQTCPRWSLYTQIVPGSLAQKEAFRALYAKH